ncbi:MAG: RluA family pseudouridine synthase [Chloroflexi bacterium]|nr:RluA family pseudouridine synthase [Chloroflexota bacterium]
MVREESHGLRQVREFVVAAGQAGSRLDLYLAALLSPRSRSSIRRLIEDQNVWLNGKPARPGTRLQSGDLLRVIVAPDQPGPALRPWDVPLDVVYEDDDMAVVNKPPGMVVHPAAGHRDDTLVNALLARYPQLAGQQGDSGWPGIVHRLDKDTSGLILVALHAKAREHLQRQFRRREVEKTYLALVVGVLEPALGRIEAPIARDQRQRKQMAVHPAGRESATAYHVRDYFAHHTLIEAKPETGRTHQIRVHLAAIGHPVAGDRVYGRGPARLPGLSRQFLHAWKISFRRPADDQWITQTVDLAPDLQTVLETIR